jgi:hypothetical protein
MKTFHEWLTEMALPTAQGLQQQVIDMAKQGLTTSEIRRRTNLARNTIDSIVRRNVGYREKLNRISAQSQIAAMPTRDQIMAAQNAGVGDEEIMRRFHITPTMLQSIIVSSQPDRTNTQSKAPDWPSWSDWQQDRVARQRRADPRPNNYLSPEQLQAMVQDYDEKQTSFNSLAQKYGLYYARDAAKLIAQAKGISIEELKNQHPHKRAKQHSDSTRACIIQGATQEFLGTAEIVKKCAPVGRSTVINTVRPFLTPTINRKIKEKEKLRIQQLTASRRG